MMTQTAPRNTQPASSQKNETRYLPLARKYRSRNFSELVGQPVLVQTLKNAIEKDRVHHAYLFTGVRGVGKTSTARLLAKALNYVGPDGKGQPTTGPTDNCPICDAIDKGRHQDVIEMDAASHTGVDDIRELIESVKYAPSSARYKIYIIDEVHMLSKNAFNALLKTLEEPPEHTIFILATTEIQKVPITILSRCQRFDLRRISVDDLSTLYQDIAQKENVTISETALRQIARAADGSARDGLSLFDQAIALSNGNEITEEIVSSMLGQADRALIFNLFTALVNGDNDKAMAHVQELYSTGAAPLVILKDLLETNHLITRIKASPNLLKNNSLSPLEQEFGTTLSQDLSVPTLTRLWQILLKGLQETNIAPNAMQALEMILIRILYSADLPPMTELLEQLKKKA